MNEHTIQLAMQKNRPPQKRVPPRRSPARPLRPVGSPRRPGSGPNVNKILAWGGAAVGTATALVVGGKIMWDNTFGKVESKPPPTPTSETFGKNATPLPTTIFYGIPTSQPTPTSSPLPTETNTPAPEYHLLTDPEEAINQATSFDVIDITPNNPINYQLYELFYPANGKLNVMYPFSLPPDKVACQTQVVPLHELTDLSTVNNRFNIKYLNKLAQSQFLVTDFQFNPPNADNPLVFQVRGGSIGQDAVMYDGNTDTLYVEMGVSKVPRAFYPAGDPLDKSDPYKFMTMIYKIKNASTHNYTFLGRMLKAGNGRYRRQKPSANDKGRKIVANLWSTRRSSDRFTRGTDSL